ncbi:MAG: transposase [Myxococcota bacterium]
MAKVIVIYTLRRNRDGTLDGPINKRVIATFGSRRHAFTLALKEALKRGYGKKPSYFLADGAQAIWAMQREFFPLATPCVDWYHVCEYLWRAGGTVFKEGSAELATWVHARKRELMAGSLDKMLETLRGLRSQIGKSGPGTKGRRERLAKAIGYLDGHRDHLRYKELARTDMDSATGAVEGAVNHVVGRRLDGSMMRWTCVRADHVLALRCVVVNGLWDHFAGAVAVEHARCRDPVIRRITPDRPQEPYDAVRKAA